MRYFSERERHEVPRNSEEISEDVWHGIRALIRAGVADGSFGATYPENCLDSPITIGTNYAAFRDAMRAQIPGLAAHKKKGDFGNRQLNVDVLNESDIAPSTLDILDLIEFCWKSVGEPRSISNHSFLQHQHLEFDVDAGREKFRNDVELIFRRNEIAYTLTEDGRIERLAPPVLRDLLAEPDFATGEPELDRLLSTARSKCLNPNPVTRQEALEALWDAWERLKTLDGDDKKAQTKEMLDATAGSDSPIFRAALETEATALTGIGNNLRIRHSETTKEMLARSEHIDYLFHRLYSLINLVLLLRKKRE